MSETYQFKFKGDDFENIYRIEATLIAESPIHIGTGDARQDKELWESMKQKEEAKKDEEPPKIDEIERDVHGLPLIPGSALRGVVRHYLLSIFRSFNGKCIAYDPDYETKEFKQMNQTAQIEYMKKASLLEQLFGTPFCESKIEFWDAPLKHKADGSKYRRKGWDPERQSYVVRSVAIDPVTGAAERNKLYSFDVVPQGLQFGFNVAGRNLSDRELGLLLFGLEGFNSPIYPLTIGAMAGRGFGRMSFKLEAIYSLFRGQLSDWVKLASTKNGAGYISIEGLKLPDEKRDEFLSKFKSDFNLCLKER